MRNHDQKVVDMVRSLLPSDIRQHARAERARINRHTRRSVTQHLRLVGSGADPLLDELDLHRTGLRQLQQLVDIRRAYDSSSPLHRWVAARVAADLELAEAPPEVRLEHFRRLFPVDAIGTHAFAHVRVGWLIDAFLAERTD